MRLRVPEHYSARHLAAALAVIMLIVLTASCDLDGASKKRAEAAGAATKSDASTGAKPPRTNLPMPPVATAHGSDATAAPVAAPPGAWTQLDGRRAKLEDLRGQVVVLDFWATYCPPCREEIPHLVRLQKQLGARGFKVVGLNVGGEEDRPKVPDFVRQYQIQYQLAEPDGETVRLFLSDDDAIPQTFVLDRRGRLIRHFVGYDSEVATELEQAITEALSEKAD
jgi:thiol-disulfide isomerase/thioredoxin